MRLDAIILADYAATAEGKLNINGGGITRMTPPEVPFILPMLSLVARWVIEPDDFGAHEVRLRFYTPDGLDLIPTDPIPVEQGDNRPTALEGEEQYMQLVFNFGAMMLPVAGVYHFSVELDGELVREFAIPVKVATGPPPPNRAERRSKKGRPAGR